MIASPSPESFRSRAAKILKWFSNPLLLILAKNETGNCHKIKTSRQVRRPFLIQKGKDFSFHTLMFCTTMSRYLEEVIISTLRFIASLAPGAASYSTIQCSLRCCSQGSAEPWRPLGRERLKEANKSPMTLCILSQYDSNTLPS